MLVAFEQSSSIRFGHIESEHFSLFGQIRPTWASFEHGISAHEDLSRNSHYSFHESRSLRTCMLIFVTKCFSYISILLQNSAIRSKLPKDSSFSALQNTLQNGRCPVRRTARLIHLYKQLHATFTSSGRTPRGVRQSPERCDKFDIRYLEN
jgi:hypothetical protein